MKRITGISFILLLLGLVATKPAPLYAEPPDQNIAAQEPDRYDKQIKRLNERNFPLVDFHVHLKGTLTLPQALANSRRVGIK